MQYYKSYWYFLSSIFFAVFYGVNAHAWEFSLKGVYNYNYEYYQQMGDKGFFGRYNIDNSVFPAGYILASGDFRDLNGWLGYQVNDIVSGATAAKHYQNLQLWPEIKITQALHFKGKYRLGTYGDPIRSEYITNTRPGVDVAASDGQWTMWWLTANTPWGMIVIGKRPEAFGLGLHYNGEYNNTTEGLAIIAPYGPLRLSFSVRPFWPDPPNSQIAARKFPDNPNVKPTPGFPYYNLFDTSGIMQLATRFFITYQSGPIDFGYFLAWQRWHAGPEAKSATNTSYDAGAAAPGPEGRSRFNPYDLDVYHGTVYLKYNNGKYFFNTEWAYYYETTNALPNLGSVPPTAPNSSGIEGNGLRFITQSWRRMVEMGALFGPSKLSFFYAYMPGPDRRNGTLYDVQPYFQSPGQGAVRSFPSIYLSSRLRLWLWSQCLRPQQKRIYKFRVGARSQI